MHAYISKTCTSFIDVPDRIAIAIYFSGCSLRCSDCQNKELWEKESGTKTDLKNLITKIKNHPLADAVVFLGGEPTDQAESLEHLCKNIKNKQRVLYTGREFEVLPKTLLPHLDLIICGPYRSDLHVDSWPASSNQRVLYKKGEKWIRKNI